MCWIKLISGGILRSKLFNFPKFQATCVRVLTWWGTRLIEKDYMEREDGNSYSYVA